MALVSFKELNYQKQHLNEVKHATLNPNGPGVVRIHIIPPKISRFRSVPSIIILNGQDILPINLSWAILLSAFIDEISPFDGKEITEDVWDGVIANVVKKAKSVYPKVDDDIFTDDLWTIMSTLTDIAYGKAPNDDIGVISIGEYARHMKAPHRMDLMISSMSKNKNWNCNQRCIHCYAANQELAEVPELTTEQWKDIIDKCRQAGIPQLTFTGGEPTLRDDLVELVEHSKWFVTRLNTNGVCLTKNLCEKLYEASLDSVQITLYSADADVHNKLVGADNFELTIDGIRNAVSAGLNVSINTPLCSLNRNYTELLKLAKELGVEYFSCSGLIMTGNAETKASKDTQLSANELFRTLSEAFEYCCENSLELSFTSPGWLSEERLREIGFTSIPSCGACLSNMAVAPNGEVIPCQSWLKDVSLGNMLDTPFKKIWNNPQCKKIRDKSSLMEQLCQLRKTTGE